MSKKMLVNAAREGEIRVVIVEDGVLEDLNIALASNEQIRGNIYRAKVVKVEASLQAAFINYGAGDNGFITFNDIREAYWSHRPERGRPRIQEVIKVGTEMIVQVMKEPMGNKGAALTCNVMLPGRYLVLMPFSSKSGVSRKIEDEETRQHLRKILTELNPPNHTGVIIRTAGKGQDLAAIKKDYQEQVRLWGHIQARMSKLKGPGILYSEPDVVMRSVRDYYTDDIEEIVTDNDEVHQQLIKFFERYIPESVNRIKKYSGKMPLFSNFGLERQLENISSPTVPLPGGGSIVVSPTEALTAIDVNSGRSRRYKTQSAMALATNLEAAVEVARQLRLRDLGGLIVVDFIDMDDLRHRQRVEQRLREAMQRDKARVELGRISRFGLLELSRQRIKARLMLSTHDTCPLCKGSGHVMTTEMATLGALRRLQELAVSAPSRAKITGRLPVEVALKLLNTERGALADLEERFNVTVSISPDPEAESDRDAFTISYPEGRRRGRRLSDSARREPKARGAAPASEGGRRVKLRRGAPPKQSHRAQVDEVEAPYEAPRVVGFIEPSKLAEADRRITEAPTQPTQPQAEPKRQSAPKAKRPAKAAQERKPQAPEAPAASKAQPVDDEARKARREAARARNLARRQARGVDQTGAPKAEAPRAEAPKPQPREEAKAPRREEARKPRREEARKPRREEARKPRREEPKKPRREEARKPRREQRPVEAPQAPKAPAAQEDMAERIRARIQARFGGGATKPAPKPTPKPTPAAKPAPKPAPAAKPAPKPAQQKTDAAAAAESIFATFM